MARNALLQPFLSSSVWNIPIGTGAAYGLPQPKAGQASLYPVTIASMTADVSPVLMDPTQPIVTWNTNGGFSATNRCTSTGGSLGSFPCSPSFIIPSAKHNYSTGAIGANGSTYLQGGSFARCSGTSGPMNPTLENSSFSTETVFGDGLKGAKGGTKMSCLGGVVRVGELVPGGTINHAIAMNIDMLANGYSHSGINGFTFPATKADGYSYDTGDGTQGPNVTNPFLCAGALLAIRPADLAGMTFATGSGGPGQILATALCHYGGYLTNDTKRSVRALCTEVSIVGDVAGTINAPGEFQTKWGYAFNPGGVGSSAWASDCDMIFSKLYVVTNNTQAQYNTNVSNYNTGNPSLYTGAGGGTPLVAFSAAPGSGNNDTPVWGNTATSSERFAPASTAQSPHYNPSLVFAAVTSEIFNVVASSPTHIGPTIACGTLSLPATAPMRP